ncbi:MAG TPA: IS3 family transposase [Sphingobacteriaceae bacterium]
MNRKSKFSIQFKEDLVKEYLQGSYGLKDFAAKHGISNQYLSRLILRYEALGGLHTQSKNNVYDASFKLTCVLSVLKDNLSLSEAASKFGVPSDSTLFNWIRRYEQFGEAGLAPKPRGRPTTMSVPKRKKKERSFDPKIAAMEDELEYLRAENAYPKKVKCLNSRGRAQKEQIQVKAIQELRHVYELRLLLRISKMARSTFYYYLKRSKEDKYETVKTLITTVFHQHKGRYGYRRIQVELQKKGHIINHKTVSRLMNELGVKCMIRRKKYRSYRGTQGALAPDLLKRDFIAEQPNQKWVTDVTEFAVAGQKLYLSPILDLYNSEIICYEMHTRPSYGLVGKMLQTAFKKHSKLDGLLMHSDQGWHYQMKSYQRELQERGVRQSMSRKGNCLDNAVMESFFGILKSELFYTKKYTTLEELKKDIKNYIKYYNNDRIKLKLNGKSPVQYRALAA